MRDIRSMRVVGAGVMGTGIAQLAATAGVTVELTDSNPAALAAADDRITARLAREVRGRIRTVADPAAPCDVDLVVEAVKEDLAVKRAVFQKLEAVCGPHTIFATNTSSFSVTSIGGVLRDPGRLAGLHFFNPVHAMRVVEVVPGVRTDGLVVDVLLDFVRELGHHPVRAADTPGFVVNHAGRGLVTEGLQILDEGVATAADIDRIARDVLGLRMGPFELLDLTGLDVSHPVLESIWSGFYGDPRLRPSPTTRVREQAGLLGRKTGAGFYSYRDGVKQEPAEPALPSYDGDLVWTDDATLASLLRDAGVRLDTGARPQADAIVLIAPFGEAVTTAAAADGLPPAHVLGVDPFGGFAGRLTLAVHPGVAPAAGRAALAVLAATGRPVTVVRDAPATVAQRLFAAIVNTAAEIAHRRIASAADIDLAVGLGLGYPHGPLAWGDQVGAGRVLDVLRAQQAGSGDPRYRPSRWIVERALTGLALTDDGLAPSALHPGSENTGTSTGTVEVNGIVLRYRVDGSAGPWVTFSNSLLTDLSIWDDQAAALAGRYRVLRYDHRGHGGTSATGGAWSFDVLADDVLGLLDALDVAETHFVGISMGGNTGAVLADRHPGRVTSLTMCDCQPASTAVSRAAWEERRESARTSGLASVVDSALERWFAPDFLAADPARAHRLRRMMRATSVEGYAGCVSILADYDLRDTVERLRVPLLLLAGERDGSAPLVLSALADRLRQARFQVIPDAGHLSCLDGAGAFTTALTTFLDAHSVSVQAGAS